MIDEVGDVAHVNIHIVCGSSTDSASVEPHHPGTGNRFRLAL
jgi:hypothetical protein